jgi:glutathione peroxidase
MSVHQFTVKNANDDEVSLADYAGKVLLIVNTASKCGFTSQYEGLEQLHQEMESEGLRVLGFPCNQFKQQEPGTNAEIQEFCQLNFGVTFPVMAKVDVNGETADPLFAHLTSEHGGDIEWNFAKFLADGDGNVRARFAPSDEPASIAPAIRELLASDVERLPTAKE